MANRLHCRFAWWSLGTLASYSPQKSLNHRFSQIGETAHTRSAFAFLRSMLRQLELLLRITVEGPNLRGQEYGALGILAVSLRRSSANNAPK